MEAIFRLRYVATSCIITFMLLLTFFIPAIAQGYKEGINLSDELLPMKINNAVGKVSFMANDIKLNMILPVYLKADSTQYLLLGANLQSMSFSGNHNEIPTSGFYSISPLIGYNCQVNPKLSLTALFIPLVNSDFHILYGSDFHFGAVGRAAYRIHKNLLLRLTLGYRQQYYGPQYIEFLGIDWKINNRWRLFGDLPNNATLVCRLNKKNNAGISYTSGGYTSYHTTENLYPVSNQSPQYAPIQQYILYNYAEPGIFAERYLTSKIVFRTTIAYATLRNLDILPLNQKVNAVLDYIPLSHPPAPLNPEIASGITIKFALSMRIEDRRY